MKVVRQQVLDTFGVLSVLVNKEMKPKGAYGVSKNKRIAEGEVKIVQEAQQKFKPSKELLEFEDKRVKVCEEWADKDEEGKAKTITEPPLGPNMPPRTRYDVPTEKMKDFEQAVEDLRAEYTEHFDAKDKIDQEFQELLQEEVEIDFHMMKLEWLPEMTGTQMEALMDIVDEG